MVDKLHLSARHQAILETLLLEHLPNVEVWVYGSRINGRSHDGSDLDLVLRGPKLKKIPSDQLEQFKSAVHESRIPFLVDTRDWSRLPKHFQLQIEREHLVHLSVVSIPQSAKYTQSANSEEHD